MFQVIYLGENYECPNINALVTAVESLRDAEIEVVDLRPQGRRYRLTIEPSGLVHETYGSRLVVRDVGLLVETPGRPVYA